MNFAPRYRVPGSTMRPLVPIILLALEACSSPAASPAPPRESAADEIGREGVVLVQIEPTPEQRKRHPNYALWAALVNESAGPYAWSGCGDIPYHEILVVQEKSDEGIWVPSWIAGYREAFELKPGERIEFPVCIAAPSLDARAVRVVVWPTFGNSNFRPETIVGDLSGR